MNWQKAYQAADFVFYCLLINVTVIIGALVGGIIFGLAPSVQAGFHVAKKTLKQESPPFFQTFFGYYRRNFWLTDHSLLFVPHGGDPARIFSGIDSNWLDPIDR